MIFNGFVIKTWELKSKLKFLVTAKAYLYIAKFGQNISDFFDSLHWGASMVGTLESGINVGQWINIGLEKIRQN